MAVCYLFFWPAQVVFSQGVSADVGGWNTGTNLGKES